MPSSRLTTWSVWGVGCLAYLIAVCNRTSLSALGPAAQEHFNIEATALSSFAVLQLVVYAGMQVPVGLLIDRYGPRVLILSGTALMLVGQTMMATVSWLPGVFLARIIVGAGDAAIFTSILRLCASWFPARQLPVVVQLTSLIGQTGQLLSVLPLALAVRFWGWPTGFLGLAGAGLLALVLGVVFLRDSPEGQFAGRAGLRPSVLRRREPVEPPVATGSLPVIDPVNMNASVNPQRVGRELLQVLRQPGVRLALWVHGVTPFSTTMMLMLWGFPFLVYGVGISPAAATGLFLLGTASSMISGVLLGWVTGRFARYRVLMVVAIVAAIILVWLAVLLWPGSPPFWLLAVMVVVISVGAPASMVSFEIVRSHVPSARLGTATGVVNVGGFVTTLLVILLVGVLLDLQGASDPSSYNLAAFRVAMSCQFVFWLLGLGLIWRDYGAAKATAPPLQGGAPG